MTQESGTGASQDVRDGGRVRSPGRSKRRRIISERRRAAEESTRRHKAARSHTGGEERQKGLNTEPEQPPLNFEEMLEDSEWVKLEPGLARAASEWHRYAAPERARLARRVERIVSPTARFNHFGRALRLGGEVGLFALGAFTIDSARAARSGGSDRSTETEHLLAALRSTRLRKTFERLGPTFVKFGQLISCMAGMLPDEVVDEFAKCVDEAPEVPFPLIEKTVDAEIGLENFAEIDPRPLAAASIAQVHAATLIGGREVVVKVRRPDIETLLFEDIGVLAHLSRLANRLFPKMKHANLLGIVTLFGEMVSEELDFRLEADSMVEVALGIEYLDVEDVYVPHPVPGLVSRRVLVMERLKGFKFGEVEAMREAGIDTRSLVRASMRMVVEGSAVAGTFHGDLHAGNVFILPDGRFGLLDFGIVARLTIAQRDALVRFLVSVVSDNSREFVSAFNEFGAFPDGVDIDTLAAELDALSEGRDQPPESLSAEDLANGIGQAFRVFARHGVQIPKDMIMFVKNLLYLNAATNTMAPDIDFFEEIGAVFEYFDDKYKEGMERIAGEALKPPEEALDTTL